MLSSTATMPPEPMDTSTTSPPPSPQKNKGPTILKVEESAPPTKAAGDPPPSAAKAMGASAESARTDIIMKQTPDDVNEDMKGNINEEIKAAPIRSMDESGSVTPTPSITTFATAPTAAGVVSSSTIASPNKGAPTPAIPTTDAPPTTGSQPAANAAQPTTDANRSITSNCYIPHFLSATEARHSLHRHASRWRPPVPDATIPSTPSHELSHVRAAVHCIVAGLALASSPGNADAGDVHPARVEARAWLLLDAAQRLHDVGCLLPEERDYSVLSAGADRCLGFRERWIEVCKMVRRWGRAAEVVVVGPEEILEVYVAAPREVDKRIVDAEKRMKEEKEKLEREEHARKQRQGRVKKARDVALQVQQARAHAAQTPSGGVQSIAQSGQLSLLQAQQRTPAQLSRTALQSGQGQLHPPRTLQPLAPPDGLHGTTTHAALPRQRGPSTSQGQQSK